MHVTDEQRREAGCRDGQDDNLIQTRALTVAMLTSRALLVCALLVVCVATLAARQAPIVQPGAPGQPAHPVSPQAAADLSAIRYTAADVQFMQRMIAHHGQALEMTALAPTRTTNKDMRLLMKRIELSQADDIMLMQQWLTSRGEPLPDSHAPHEHDAALMPGMLTDAEMAQLAASKGATFDRRFLEFMIKHHQGAVFMVDQLFATTGAGQDSEIFAFASDVVADQQAEMARMAAMLKERQR